MTLRKNVGPENFSKIFLKITHSYTHTHKNKKQQKIWLKKEANEKDVKREHAWYYIISKKNEEIKNYNGLRIHI